MGRAACSEEADMFKTLLKTMPRYLKESLCARAVSPILQFRVDKVYKFTGLQVYSLGLTRFTSLQFRVDRQPGR